ncbi:MarR family winged helix-turn-helix transcriptional regulator [Lysinibacter cavernae]|uniref:DNA-binding MarR family transcriptional regulator n=1 Tax=Lysinibacter cavernae TaxID=1640652 RepID=A0A7X5R403_9MICO|nr:MarR family transcriptional regulator [Lysinibacter cavernae]NIH55201.1 DNA-binding MarR family transcriptional regulator [Lysinibacter cavernae]
MTDSRSAFAPDENAIVDPRVIDPQRRFVDRPDMTGEELDNAVTVLNALRRWRTADQAMRNATQSNMGIGENDMKAMRFLIAAHGNDEQVTAKQLTKHLGISSASTSKLLDRLEASGHITREPHPHDRRAVLIAVTDESHKHIRATLGDRHTRMFNVAAALNDNDRKAVLGFLAAMSEISEANRD